MAAVPIQAPEGKHVVFTGPVSGSVSVDGRDYDVSPVHIFVGSHDEAQAVAEAIASLHAEQFPDFYVEAE